MSVFVLFLYLVALTVSFWATTRIITQAGYSAAWVLMPLSSLVLTIVVFIMMFVDLRSLVGVIPFGIGGTVSFSGLGAIETLWHLDMVSIVANWILFLVFAFSRWPFAGDAGRRAPASPLPEGGGLGYGRREPDVRPSDGSLATRSNASSNLRADTGVTPHSVAAPRAESSDVRPVRAKHCAWCGEPLPGSRALFHDCGTKDRPATNCAACGAALSSEGANCLVCAPSQ